MTKSKLLEILEMTNYSRAKKGGPTERTAMHMAQHGNQEELDWVMANKTHYTAKYAALDRIGKKNWHKHLNNPHKSVRYYIARFGTNAHRDALINDKSSDVRRTVAEYGTHSHREALINDRHPNVRIGVALRGNDRQRAHLTNDPDENVRHFAEADYARDWRKK